MDLEQIDKENNDNEPQLPPLPSQAIPLPITDSTVSNTTGSNELPGPQNLTKIPSRLTQPDNQYLVRRKRPRFHSAATTLTSTTPSSDPALFSADEESDHAENYFIDLEDISRATKRQKRKKQLYSGSWWKHDIEAERSERRREFKRNLDSGIFMGSEDLSIAAFSSDSLADEFIEDQKLKDEDKASNKQVILSNTGSNLQPRVAFSPAYSILERKLSPAMEAAKTIIENCLEQGKEVIDLSSMSLTDLPPETSSLETITKTVNIIPATVHYGLSFEPRLKFYLANNKLTRVPRPILNLTNLRILSLRQNNLTNLPAGFYRLEKLQELNISGNQLQTLPSEIHTLMTRHSLKNLIAHPNPWLAPSTIINKDTEFHVREITADRNIIFRRAETSAQLEASDNSEIMSIFSRPITSVLREEISSKVPCLSEVVLRNLVKNHPDADLLNMMPYENTPQKVLDRLALIQGRHFERLPDAHSSEDEKYEHLLGAGLDRKCESCRRLIVEPGTEWIEWCMWDSEDGLSWLQETRGDIKLPLKWQKRTGPRNTDVSEGEKYIPFVRMLCQKSCGREDVDEDVDGDDYGDEDEDEDDYEHGYEYY